MFAIVSFKGKQYKMEAQKTYNVDLIPEGEKTVSFDEVLLFSDEKTTKVGDPTVKGAKVEAEILGNLKAEKVQVVKFRPKKRYMRRNGHRQNYTKVKILSINA